MEAFFEGGTVTVGDMDVAVCGRDGWLTEWEDMTVGL